MALVTLRTIVGGREETLREHLCDWPDCPNVAVEVVGVARDIRLAAAYCAQHAARLKQRRDA